LKYKPVETFDFKIIDVFEGKGKHKGRLGGFIIELEDGSTCAVGSGFNDAERIAYWEERPIDLFCEIKFKMRTPDGKLREPIFVRMRLDKGYAE
jgi:DNA ligase-1